MTRNKQTQTWTSAQPVIWIEYEHVFLYCWSNCIHAQSDCRFYFEYVKRYSQREEQTVHHRNKVKNPNKNNSSMGGDQRGTPITADGWPNLNKLGMSNYKAGPHLSLSKTACSAKAFCISSNLCLSFSSFSFLFFSFSSWNSLICGKPIKLKKLKLN